MLHGILSFIHNIPELLFGQNSSVFFDLEYVLNIK